MLNSKRAHYVGQACCCGIEFYFEGRLGLPEGGGGAKPEYQEKKNTDSLPANRYHLAY